MAAIIEIASLPDYERLVAEIWFGDKQIGLLSCETPPQVMVELFDTAGMGSDLEFHELMSALIAAHKRLVAMDIPNENGDG